MIGLNHLLELVGVIVIAFFIFKIVTTVSGSARIGIAVTGALVGIVFVGHFLTAWVQTLFAGPLPAPAPSHLAVLSTTIGYTSRATPPPTAITVETSASVYLVSGIDPLLSDISGNTGASVTSVCAHLKPSVFQLYDASGAWANIGRVSKDETLHVVLPAGAVATPGTPLAGVDPITAYTDDGYVGSVCAWQTSDLVVSS